MPLTQRRLPRSNRVSRFSTTGPMKGGNVEMFERLHQVNGLEDVWQLHRSTRAGAQNFADGPNCQSR
jgi:hypothetical protein